MHLFSDILDFLGNLTFIDYVFFFAVLVLIILIVTLIYFIKINDDVFSKDKDTKKEPTQEMKIVEEINKVLNNPASEKITRELNIESYEKDQEEKAIISYDELLKQDHNYELNYEKEEYLDDLSVKKLDLDNLVTEKEGSEKPNFNGRVISFAKEEAFLKALKQLQKELN